MTGEREFANVFKVSSARWCIVVIKKKKAREGSRASCSIEGWT
jgi:hypothetical protein